MGDVALETISVTATRTPTALERQPSATQVIDRSQIERLDAQRLTDVLKIAQGVTLQKRGTRDTVSIRGFTNEQTLILIDGRRLASEPSQKFELDRITLANVERIEIVRGPASALYGADALGGVINVITRRPESNEVDWQVRCGRHEMDGGDGCDGGFHVSLMPLDTLGLSFSGTLIDQPAIDLDSGVTQIDAERLQDMAFQADWRITPSLTLGVMLKYLATDSYFDALSGSGKFNRTDEEDERTDTALTLGYDDGDRAGELQLYYSRLDKDREMRLRDSRKLQEFDEIRVEKSALDGHFTFSPLEGHRLTVGGEYRREDFRGTTIDTGKSAYWVMRDGKTATGSEADIDYYAAFVQDQWQVSPRLDLVLGGRFDASDTFDDQPTGKLGAVYRLFDAGPTQLRLKAQFAQGYRAPTVRDLYLNVTKSKFTRFGNPDLDPEHSNSFDLALEGRRGAIDGRIGFFHSEVRDLIAEETIGRRADRKPIRRYANIDEARLQGLEASLDWRGIPDLGLGLDYMYLDARDETTDARLEDRPRHRILARFDYDYRPWGLQLTLNGNYNLDELSSLSGEEESYGTWDLHFSKTLNGELDLKLGVENLLDERDDDLLLTGRYLYVGLNGYF
ncbi:TonB-dependent receptor [Imhoffiella purpurea]|uniref:TonB-dependent receptor n=1 Tax=Imhoffiella purpurea TaxID=1249627 RepID=W9V447_9GAMM|nr:TonB-dependent receptor [Imhoffiella purpurea]